MGAIYRAAGAAALLLGLAFAAAPAHAKTCMEVPITAKATSRAQLSDASREARARENAITNWTRRARDTHGYLYSFWFRAEDKKIECGGGESSKHCTVSARACRLY